MFSSNISHRFTTNGNKLGKVLKIIFVLELILTGPVLEVFNTLNFSQPKEVKGPDTLIQV